MADLPDKRQVIEWAFILILVIGIIYVAFLPSPDACASINETWTIWGCQ